MDYEVNTKKRKRRRRNTKCSSAGTYGSTSGNPSGREYEVFLSFRGEDTRMSFTDFLYKDLVDAGIHTFRDNDELRVGEEIGPELLRAINESKISIPIFSKNYASSKWCLLELTHMLKCHSDPAIGQKILPIFYDVEPSDVRNQKGSYEEAFRQHEERFDDGETVQGWKEALRKVGELKGWELEKETRLEKETSGHQGELVKIVVSEVLLELKKNCMVVTNNLVGIDHHVDKMMGLINIDSVEALIVGIVGMGGIGKTTIAKVIYNQLSEAGRFECCCFLADVRETSKQHKGLVDLQSQLICKIVKRKGLEIANVEEGINTIKYKLRRKKALIILDDVDKKSQFDMLVGERDWIGYGSRIIVTTRSKEVLNVLEVDEIYESPFMEPDHSLQLFCKHAFRRDFPLGEFRDLSKKFVSIAAGLPLVLEVIGSSLLGKGMAEWEETLTKLKEVPHDQVKKKLRISYDALTYGQKQIFLDIACLFIGKDKRLVFYMWNDCKFYPIEGINTLILKSLIQIGDDSVLRMHDQLRDLGREIVREENFNDPGSRSRLWLQEEALDVLERQMGTKEVEALCIPHYVQPSVHVGMGYKHCFTNNEFGKLPNLRYLQLNGGDFDGDFKNLFSKLRWLQWTLGSSRPTNLDLKNLVILDLSYSNITDDWKSWSQIKMTATRLKVLDLSWCSWLTKTPDFSTFASLEILKFEFCKYLVEIDTSIGKLVNLRGLYISKSGIKELPDAIGNLVKLEDLDASGCRNLEGEIPSDIGRLSSLKILSLDHTRICSLPKSICGLSRLETLDLNECWELQSLPELPPCLKSLHVECRSMEIFPSLSKMVSLTLGEIDNISTLPAEIGDASHLKILQVYDCRNLQTIPGLPSCLFELSLYGCESVERLPDLSNLKQLSLLRLDRLPKLMEIEGIGKLELDSLRYLDTSDCVSIERLPDLSNFKNIQELVIKGCDRLTEIQGLDRLESLEEFSMSECISIEKLPDLSNLGMLKQLLISQCQKLAEVEGLGGLKSLETLDVSQCMLLQGLPDLSKLKKLRKIKLCGWENLTEIRGLGEMESLEMLDISGCTLMDKTPDLSNLKKLKRLIVFWCEKLSKIQGLEELKSLKTLDITGCKSIENLSDLSNTEILRNSEEARMWKQFH